MASQKESQRKLNWVLKGMVDQGKDPEIFLEEKIDATLFGTEHRIYARVEGDPKTYLVREENTQDKGSILNDAYKEISGGLSDLTLQASSLRDGHFKVRLFQLPEKKIFDLSEACFMLGISPRKLNKYVSWGAVEANGICGNLLQTIADEIPVSRYDLNKRYQNLFKDQ